MSWGVLIGEGREKEEEGRERQEPPDFASPLIEGPEEWAVVDGDMGPFAFRPSDVGLGRRDMARMNEKGSFPARLRDAYPGLEVDEVRVARGYGVLMAGWYESGPHCFFRTEREARNAIAQDGG